MVGATGQPGDDELRRIAGLPPDARPEGSVLTLLDVGVDDQAERQAVDRHGVDHDGLGAVPAVDGREISACRGGRCGDGQDGRCCNYEADDALLGEVEHQVLLLGAVGYRRQVFNVPREGHMASSPRVDDIVT